ncbi:MAG: zinc ABC transporter substrate-binding protein [Cognatishimia sp.]|nr:zinc ABC transporter substrate-binding protein [Cognatishimia sp.]
MRFSRRVLLSFVMAVMAVPSVAMDRLNVVATTGMIADAARQVGGDLVEVQGLMGPGVDPHAYRQTRSDIVAMTRADLVLWHGLYLEAQMEDFFTDLAAKRNVVEVAAGLEKSLLRGHDDYDDKFDPHVWMNPDIWALIVGQVQSALTAAQPESAAIFAANAEIHLEEITRLSGYAKSALASVPEQSRVLLSAHDAFGYFGEAYGFEVLGIQGISTESEAGLNRISELVDLLVSRDIRAVFVETSVSDRSMRAVIEGAAAKGHTVSIGGELFSDAMGQDGTYEGTYIGMIDHNATVITNALGGDAPLRGLNDKLSAGS